MRKLALLSATLLTLGVTVALAPQAAATTGLTATFTASAGGGKYVVANSTAAAITGWSIAFDLPAGVTASNPQNGTLTQTGAHVVATPAYYINTVAAHGNTEPYSLAFSLSSAAAPTNCLLNGVNCDGSGGTTPPPVTAAVTAQYSQSGSTGKYVVSNNFDTDLKSWSIAFDLPSGTTVSNGQNGTVTQTGTHVVATPAYYNTVVKAHSTTEPYSLTFTVSGSGSPQGCRVNDSKCDGTADTPPGAPTNLHSTAKTTKTVLLAWNAATPGDLPVAGYDVYNGSTLATSVTGTTASVTGLTPKTSYTFTVKAKDAHGTSSAGSAPVTVTTNDPSSDTQPPSAPTNLAVTGKDSTSISLDWSAATDNTGVVSYDVYNGSAVATTVTGTSATVTGLSPSTQYTFTVKARDGYDNVSAASNAVTASTSDVIGNGYAKVGYFVQWGIYGRQYFVKNLVTTGAAAKLTHLLYAFENIDPVNLTCLSGVTKGTTANPEDPSQGDGGGDADADYGRPMSAAQAVNGVADDGFAPLRGNLNQLKELKALYPNLKILVSIGGWTYSKYFSDVAKTDASRKKFVSSCLDTWIKGNLPVTEGAGGQGVGAGIFDGIDLDWEWPGDANGHPGNHYSAADKANLTALLAEFRTELDALGASTGKRYQLTAFTPADPTKVSEGWDLPQTAKSLDIFNVQGYDFHGSGSDNSWEPNRTGDQANLYPAGNDPYSFHFSVDGAVQTYLSAGVNPRKMTVGIPFYGRGWQGVTDGGAHGEWQAANGAAPGQFAEEAGTRGYSNLISSLPGMTVYHNTQAVATYGYDGSQWWTFDDTWSIGQKMAYIKSKGLLGAMIWEMSGDTGTLMSAVDSGLR